MDAFYTASDYASVYAYYYYHHAGINLGIFKIEDQQTDAQLDVQENQKRASSFKETIIGVSPANYTTSDW